MASNSFLQFTFVCPNHNGVALEERLFDLGAMSITTNDGSETQTTPIIDANWPISRLRAVFPLDSDVSELRLCLDSFGCQSVETQFLTEHDWLTSSHSKKSAIQIGPFLIAEEPTPKSQAVVPITLTGGLAFGTGEHATTSLCLEWLSSIPMTNRAVLDLGSGTGILGIAAYKRGANSVTAVDTDSDARRITCNNAKKNGVVIEVASEIDTSLKFDVVVANILSNTLIELAPSIESVLQPGGNLALSGILEHQVNSVRNAYQSTIFAETQVKEGWVLLSGLKTQLLDSS